MFEAKFQTFDDARQRGGERAARQGVAHRAGAARAHRLRRAARRPPPERISAGLGGAARLADRLHRLGRRGDRADGPRRAVRRRPLHACRRASRSTPRCSRSCTWSRRRPTSWIERTLAEGRRARLRPVAAHRRGRREARQAPAPMPARRSSPVEPNPIDEFWKDRPAPPLGAVTLHDIRFAGEAAETKLATIRPEIAKLKADALVVSDPHAVAWTFNIRGSDVSHTPLPLAFAIIPREGRPSLFIDGRKLGNDVRAPARRARRRARARRFRRRTRRARQGRQDRAPRPGDRRRRAGADRHRRRRQGRRKGPDPIALMKAVKNPVEIDGAREAHRRDGAAMTRFLAWFDREAPNGQAHRDRRGRGAGTLPPRDRPAQGRVVPDHRRRGTGRRDRALSRHPQDRPRRSRRANCS